MSPPPDELCTRVLQHAPVGVAVLRGEELRVLFANPAILAMFGIDRPAQGEGVEALLPEAQQTTLERFRQVIRSGKPLTLREFESPVITTKEGRPTYWDIDCRPLDVAEDGRIETILLLVENVTSHVALRREAEQRAKDADAARAALVESEGQLAEREALLQLALEAAQIGAWEYDYASRKVRYSASRNTLYGLSTDEIVADPDVFFARIHPDDYRPLKQAFADARGTNQVEQPFRIIRADGDVRHVILRARIIRDATGVTVRMVGVDVDMTAEYALRERLEQFARTVAHDLRSPLQTIRSYGELLLRSARMWSNSKDREYLTYILGGASKMNTLIEGLLAYAYASHAKLEREVVDLDAVVDDVRETLKATIEAAGAAVTHERLPTVSGHRVLLTQVFQNLIANALKFRAERVPAIHVGMRRGDGEWIIGVHDNGLGIPPDRQGRLFEAFARAHQERAIPGLGLGLALVREAVRQHGGRVWLESVPDEGTTFYFSLPDRGREEHRSS